MTSESPRDQVASGPDLSRLWYADPTGQTAVRNIMLLSRTDDYSVVDNRGNVLFRIKPAVLADLVRLLHFTETRRGRTTIRAHKKKVPVAPGTQNQHPTITKEN